jgi:tetratricopeptide (TPR) repeat protein
MEMDPSFAMAHYQLGQALVQVHNYDEAIRELQQAIELSGGNPLCTSQLGLVYGLSGRRNEALKILDDLKNRSNHKPSYAADIALVYTGLNERDQAFAWLEKAYVERFNPSILARPAFDMLRSDPRFQDLLRRLGLSLGTGFQLSCEVPQFGGIEVRYCPTGHVRLCPMDNIETLHSKCLQARIRIT